MLSRDLEAVVLLAVIVACEIGFWVVLAAGLTARYVLRRPRLGGALLVCVPLVDLVLLAATVLHLRDGATADFTHGLAAAYLGFTVAFGHSLVRRADAHFAHRFAGAPAPGGLPRSGPARVAHEWRTWSKIGLAWGVACTLLALGIVLVDDAARTEELGNWILGLSAVLAVALAWPVSYSVRAATAGERH